MFIKCFDEKGKTAYVKPEYIVRFYENYNGDTVIIERDPDDEPVCAMYYTKISPDSLMKIIETEEVLDL
jgi:molybdopterin-guanine dinucleotide biosynthesis protein A